VVVTFVFAAAARIHLSSPASSTVSTYQPSTMPSFTLLGLRRFSTRTSCPEKW
jgi:hypothetical protein